MAEEKAVVFEGLSKWKAPFVYELAGKSFLLAMDDGHDYLVQFVSGETAIWSKDGEPAQWESYDCLKGDENTYFVNAEMHGFPLRTGVTLILDLEQSLVTMLIAHHGENLKFPTMVTNKIIFGAIKKEGEPLPKKRHGFTTDLMGMRITWSYDEAFIVTHAYYHPNYYRMGAMDPSRAAMFTPEQLAERRANPTDEPSQYVKIKENLYLFNFIETTHFLRGRNGNNMTFLIDTARLHDVGRSFGLGQGGLPENYCFSAIGKWQESDGAVENAPSAYRV